MTFPLVTLQHNNKINRLWSSKLYKPVTKSLHRLRIKFVKEGRERGVRDRETVFLYKQRVSVREKDV